MANAPNIVSARAAPAVAFDPRSIRGDFPMLEARVNGRPLIYLDSAATTQKPKAVIDRLYQFYSKEYAKTAEEHALSKVATANVEATRKKAAALLGAKSPSQIEFARNATNALHIVAYGLSQTVLKPGDEILLTELEHHSNIIPWIMAAERTGARIVVAPITDSGDIDLDALRERLTSRTRIVAVSHVSHVLGTVTPVSDICALARANGSITVVDGAQATPHVPIDVTQIGCDFYIGCGHRPTGRPVSASYSGRRSGYAICRRRRAVRIMLKPSASNPGARNRRRIASCRERRPSPTSSGSAPRWTISRRLGSIRSGPMKKISTAT